MRLGQTGTIASLPLLCPIMMMLGASRNGTFDIMLPTAFAFAPGGSIPVQPHVIQRAHTRSSGTASSPYVHNNPASTHANTAMNKLRTLHLRSLDTERQEDFLTDNKDTEKSAQAELNQRSMLETRLQMDLAAKERKNGTASNNNNNISINEGPPIAEVQVEPKEENAPAGKGGEFFFAEAEAEAEEEKAEENTLEEQANAQVSDPDIESVPQADDENFQQQVEDLLDHVNDILKDDDVDVAVNEKDPENEIEVVPVAPEVKVASPTEMKKPDTGMVEAESSAKVEIITEKNSGVEMSKNEDFLKAVGGAAFEASRWLLSEIRVGAAEALTASIPTDRRSVLIDKWEGKYGLPADDDNGLSESENNIPLDRVSMLKEIAAALAEQAEQSRLDEEMWEKEKEELKLAKEMEAAANQKVVAELAAQQERLERESTELEEKKLAVDAWLIDVSKLQKEIDAEKVALEEKKKAIEVKELAAVEKQQKLDSELNKMGEMKSTVEAQAAETAKQQTDLELERNSLEEMKKAVDLKEAEISNQQDQFAIERVKMKEIEALAIETSKQREILQDEQRSLQEMKKAVELKETEILSQQQLVQSERAKMEEMKAAVEDQTTETTKQKYILEQERVQVQEMKNTLESEEKDSSTQQESLNQEMKKMQEMKESVEEQLESERAKMEETKAAVEAQAAEAAKQHQLLEQERQQLQEFRSALEAEGRSGAQLEEMKKTVEQQLESERAKMEEIKVAVEAQASETSKQQVILQQERVKVQYMQGVLEAKEQDNSSQQELINQEIQKVQDMKEAVELQFQNERTKTEEIKAAVDAKAAETTKQQEVIEQERIKIQETKQFFEAKELETASQQERIGQEMQMVEEMKERLESEASNNAKQKEEIENEKAANKEALELERTQMQEMKVVMESKVMETLEKQEELERQRIEMEQMKVELKMKLKETSGQQEIIEQERVEIKRMKEDMGESTWNAVSKQKEQERVDSFYEEQNAEQKGEREMLAEVLVLQQERETERAELTSIAEDLRSRKKILQTKISMTDMRNDKGAFGMNSNTQATRENERTQKEEREMQMIDDRIAQVLVIREEKVLQLSELKAVENDLLNQMKIIETKKAGEAVVEAMPADVEVKQEPTENKMEEAQLEKDIINTVETAPPSVEVTATEIEDTVHPILGSLISDLGYKRIHLASANQLSTIPVWEKQRTYRHDRAEAMANEKAETMNLGFPGVICVHEGMDGKLSILDGQHRLGMMQALQQKNGLKFDNTMFDRVLVEVYTHSIDQDSNGNTDTFEHAKEIFLEINKAEPIRLVDIPEADLEIISAAVSELKNRHPDMFSPKFSCSAPYVNEDMIINLIFESHILKKPMTSNKGFGKKSSSKHKSEKIDSGKKLADWLKEKNTALGKEYKQDREKRDLIGAKEWTIASEKGFYLGLENSWLYN